MNRKNIPVLKTLFVKFYVILDDNTINKECYTGTTVVNSCGDNKTQISDKLKRIMEKEFGHSKFKIDIVSISRV